MSDAEIIQLYGGEASDHKAPLRSKPKDPQERYCRHKRVELGSR